LRFHIRSTSLLIFKFDSYVDGKKHRVNI
jgi:hypothetical protein